MEKLVQILGSILLTVIILSVPVGFVLCIIFMNGNFWMFVSACFLGLSTLGEFILITLCILDTILEGKLLEGK